MTHRGRYRAKQRITAKHPSSNATVPDLTRTFGTLTVSGGVLLTLGAILTDLGLFAEFPAIGSIGNALSAAAGLGLVFLPVGLRAGRLGGTGTLANAGTATLVIGICLASLSDVPAILDPTALEVGGALGPVGLVLLSAGFLLWFVAVWRSGTLYGWQKYLFLVAGLWFPLTLPAVQLPLFVIPNGRPSFILLAGVLGLLQLGMGIVIRGQANRTPSFHGGRPCRRLETGPVSLKEEKR